MQVVHLLPGSLYISLPPRFTTFSNKYWTNSDCSILSCLGNSFPFGHGVSEFFSYETLFTHLFPYMVLHKSAELRGIFRFFPTDSNGFRVIQRIFLIFRRKIPRNFAESVKKNWKLCFFFKLFLTNSA